MAFFGNTHTRKRVGALIKQRIQASKKPATSGFKKLYDKKKAASKRPSQRDRLVSAIKNRQKKRSSVRDWFKSRGRR